MFASADLGCHRFDVLSRWIVWQFFHREGGIARRDSAIFEFVGACECLYSGRHLSFMWGSGLASPR